jgi:acyl-CoA synthetase (NDP forming)
MELKEIWDSFFYPKRVVIIGASSSSKKMGYHALKSLKECDFKGEVFVVNPKYQELLGVRCYPSLEAIPGPIDLAIMVIPSKEVIETLPQCGKKGIRCVLVITSGFSESDLFEGKELQKTLKKVAQQEGIRIIGPNTFGFVNLDGGLNASFTPSFSSLRKGGVSLLSQSGGICHLIMAYAMRENIGLNKIVGLGNRVNTDFWDLLPYLGLDESTKSIALYLEGVEEPRRLMEAIREVVKSKPLVVYKSGKSQKADEAAKSHTGSLAGPYRVYQGALKQCGAILAKDPLELISVAEALSLQNPPRAKRIAVISLVAGLGMVMADLLEENGFELASFSELTQKKLFALMPPYTIRTNPVDLGYIANNKELCGEVIKTVFEDENVDGVILSYIYSWSEDFLELPVEAIIEAMKKTEKPSLMCLDTPPGIWEDERKCLKAAGLPIFTRPDLTVRALSGLWEYGRIRERNKR